MAKSLAALIRLHRWQVDEKRRVLAAKLRHLETLEGRLQELEAEMAREQQIANASSEAAYFFGSYALGVHRRREQINQSIAVAETDAEKAREAVRIVFNDLKKFEQAEDARVRREDAARERLDRIDLDEIGLQGHRRRHV